MKRQIMLNLTMAAVAAVTMTADAGLFGKKVPQFDNADFYATDGTFDVEMGKDAIIAMCEYHGYPIFPGFREKLWVSDYGTGKFTELGLAAYMFVNNETDQYMQMDLFLLPNQMLPEHWHLAANGNPVKMEGWLVRYGKTYAVGVGEDNLKDFPEVVIPECHDGGNVMTKKVTPTTPGQFTKLTKAESRHWQFGGIEGVIMTESANVHTDAGVRHTDKGVNDNFLGN